MLTLLGEGSIRQFGTLGRTLIVSNLDSSQVWSGTDVRKIGGPIGNDRSTISQSSIAEWSQRNLNG